MDYEKFIISPTDNTRVPQEIGHSAIESSGDGTDPNFAWLKMYCKKTPIRWFPNQPLQGLRRN